MKTFKRIMLIILILITTCVLFRGWIYRHLVTYRTTGQRTDYTVTNKLLAESIERRVSGKKKVEIKDIIKTALSITSRQLNFTFSKCDTDPNRLITSRKTHCVGYASFFCTTCNYLLKKYKLSGIWTAKQQSGHLYFVGININKHFNSPFFKDHDFVTIENQTTGQSYSVDPTVNDYSGINFVTFRK